MTLWQQLQKMHRVFCVEAAVRGAWLGLNLSLCLVLRHMHGKYCSLVIFFMGCRYGGQDEKIIGTTGMFEVVAGSQAR